MFCIPLSLLSWAAFQFAAGTGTAPAVSSSSVQPAQALSSLLSHLKMLADWKPRRQPLPFCCNWKLPSGFLLWRHRSVNDRKVRPGP